MRISITYTLDRAHKHVYTPSMEDELTAYFIAKESAPRRYASFFHVPRGLPHSKKQTEACVLQCFIESLQRNETRNFSHISIPISDPPDFCICEHEKEGNIGVEITELVSQKTIEYNINNPENPKFWNPNETEVANAIQALLQRKSKAQPKDSYREYWVVIHCDEIIFRCEERLRQAIYQTVFHLGQNSLRPIDRAFLIFSYCPAIQSYPLFELTLTS